MTTIFKDVTHQARVTVSWDSCVAKESAVSRACGHGGDYRNTWPEFRCYLVDCPHQFGVQRRRRTERVRAVFTHDHAVIADYACKRILHFFYGLTWKYATVDRRSRQLRERIRCVSAGKHCCDARGAELRVVD